MSLKPGTGDQPVTLGITSLTASSISVFAAFTVFTAMSWFYTGPIGAEKTLFYIGNDPTPLAAGRYVKLTMSAAGVLTLAIFDGTTLTEVTGSTLAADTWYHWSYVKGTSSNNHRIYLSEDGDLSFQGATLDIETTVTDGITPLGIFLFVPSSSRVCQFKLWTLALSQGQVRAERDQWWWAASGSAFTNLRHVSPLRITNDLLNHHPSDGGIAYVDHTNIRRTHLTNIGGLPLAFAHDPLNLLAARCITQIPSNAFAEVVDNPGLISATTIIDRTQHRPNPAFRSRVPSNAIVAKLTLCATYGFFDPGLIGGDIEQSCGREPGVAIAWDVGGYQSGTGGNDVMFFRCDPQHQPGPSDLWDPIIEEEEGIQERWLDMTVDEALDRIFTYYWGWRSVWSPISPPDDCETHRHTELWFRIQYDTPEQIATCVCAPRPEYGGGFGYTACCAPTVEGVSPFSPTPWDETCDGAGSGGPDGVNGTDAENWAE